MLTLDKLKKLAIASGIVGFLLFILTPFLPVNQTQSTIHWPQGDNQSITAPLMSYAPEKLEATIPVAAFDELHDGQNLLLGTLPQDSKDATQRGLFIRLGDNGLDAVVKDKVIFSITQEDVDKLAPTDELKLTSDADKTTVTLGTHEGEATGDERPQVTGLYTELNRDAEIPGLSADITVNSRFTSSPSLIKYLAMWSGIACLLVSLFSLWKFDQLAGDHHLRAVRRDEVHAVDHRFEQLVQRVEAPTRRCYELDPRIAQTHNEVVRAFRHALVSVEERAVHIAGDKLDHQKALLEITACSDHCTTLASTCVTLHDYFART